jgi:hypothetical protein
MNRHVNAIARRPAQPSPTAAPVSRDPGSRHGDRSARQGPGYSRCLGVRLDLAGLSKQVGGLTVSSLTQSDNDSLEVHFTNGSTLVVHPAGDGMAAALTKPQRSSTGAAVASAPTDRQREYLEFIKKFMHRFGVAPAESDIQRHFLVSAPSVNQMIRTLEQKGFLVRDRDWSGHAVPRSIRVLWES